MQRLSPISKASLPWLLRVALLFGAAFAFAILGPFGTYASESFLVRFSYWFIVLGAAGGCVQLVQWIGINYLAGWDLWLRLAIEAACFTLLFSPLAWVVSGMFAGGPLGLAGFAFIIGNVLALTSISVVLTYLFAEEPEPQVKIRPRLNDRLPATALAEIVRLTVNDHYVVVCLDDGTDHRVLMRLADAVREMDDTPGFCTHRSHWVSLAHVAGRVREGGRDYLEMSDGARVPVSKTYQKNVVAAGFA